MKCYYNKKERIEEWAVVVEKDSDYAESWRDYNNGVAWCLIFTKIGKNPKIRVGYHQVWVEGNEIKEYDFDIPIETKRKSFITLFWGVKCEINYMG
jgi:hypothetical protein